MFFIVNSFIKVTLCYFYFKFLGYDLLFYLKLLFFY
jgi:hypothetical protein